MSLTPTGVLNRVRDQAFESDAAFWTDAEIFRYMTDAERIIADRTNSTEAIGTSITTVAGTRSYSLANTVYDIMRVEYNGRPVKRISWRDFDTVAGLVDGGPTRQGRPVYYVVHARTLYFEPIPSEAKGVKIYHVKETTALTTSSTAFTIPRKLTHLIQDYILYRMYLKDDELQKANFHLGLWESALKEAEEQWNERSNLDRIRVVKVEDNYPQTELGII